MPNINNKIHLSAMLAALAIVLSLGAAQATLHNYEATLEGTQEVPPNGSTATGSGTFVIDDVLNTVDYVISYEGLSGAETAAHIHGMAPPGANAGVLHPLPLGTPKVGTWNYTEDQEAGILGGLTYVNIHTSTFPGGEIRGQIVPVPEGCFLNCPAGDGGMVNIAGLGNKSPDLNGDSTVDLVDFALFGSAYGTSDYCADFDCSGDVVITDFALFGQHFQHSGAAGGVCE